MTFHQIHLIVFLLFSSFKIYDCVISVSIAQSTYNVEYGSSVSIQATLTDLTEYGTVWSYYLTSNPLSPTFIYLENGYSPSADRTKFSVTYSTSGSNLISTLVISNILASDALYTFEVSCNLYRVAGCTSSNKATATLVVITTTSTTTTTTTSTTTTTITTTAATTTSTNSSNSTYCLDGAWNTVQYTLIILNLLVLVISSFLFHFSFYGTVPETFFLILTLVLSLVLIVASLIFWINPTLSSDSSMVAIIIVCCELGACFFLWILILQYSIRLGLNNEISLVINVIICIIGVFELGSAILLIVSNAYCTRKTSISSLSDFNYSYMELIGALFLVLFSLFLLMIAGVVFFIRKKKKESEKFSNLGKVFSPINTPFNIQRLPSVAQRPDNNVRDLWKAKKINTEDEILPEKPTKLTPLFSKKRNDTFVSDVEPNKSKIELLESQENLEIKSESNILKEEAHIGLKAEKKMMDPMPYGWQAKTLTSLDLKPQNELNRSRTMLGGRRVSDIALDDTKNNKNKKTSKRNQSLSVDRDDLLSNDFSGYNSNNESFIKKNKSNSLTRISLS
ncbi:unnamed protein product [Brachionus calyciflorus]|uniref:Uncharacterized protein n=1 Tax=Brachionus calyciflorus TaxID=104777 RepID=A0A814D6J5_9BILA|nr:unnamed protein product [Brachionus calyciflorus]